jgi:hypothetical protein
MTINKGLFTSASEHWATPRDLYKQLDNEFHFNDDPCPLKSTTDGLSRAWGTITYCNPPYGRKIGDWIRKGYDELLSGKTVVMLLPSRTDTKWWHEYCMKAHEIRFLKGRLHFNESKNSAPFPSVIVIFKGGH